MERIVIPDKIRSRNEIDKYNWAKKSRLKKTYQVLIRNQMRLNKLKECEVHDVFDLKIISYRTRQLDHDNLVGGSKQLIDALCDECFIWDDSPKYLNNIEFKQISIKEMKDKTLIERVPVCK